MTYASYVAQSDDRNHFIAALTNLCELGVPAARIQAKTLEHCF